MTTSCIPNPPRQEEGRFFQVWVLTFITNRRFVVVYLHMFQFDIANKTMLRSSSPFARCDYKIRLHYHLTNVMAPLQAVLNYHGSKYTTEFGIHHRLESCV